jgi:hypothetical protein
MLPGFWTFIYAQIIRTVTMSETGDIPKERRVWYRSTFFNATIIGLCALFAPGLYNAMASTGAGGAQTPYLVSQRVDSADGRSCAAMPFCRS